MAVLLAMAFLMVLFGVALLNADIGAAVPQPPALLGVFVPMAVLASIRKLAPVERTGWLLAAAGFAIGSGAHWLGNQVLSAAGWLSMGVATAAYAGVRKKQLTNVAKKASRRNQLLAFLVVVLIVASILLLPPSGP